MGPGQEPETVCRGGVEKEARFDSFERFMIPPKRQQGPRRVEEGLRVLAVQIERPVECLVGPDEIALSEERHAEHIVSPRIGRRADDITREERTGEIELPVAECDLRVAKGGGSGRCHHRLGGRPGREPTGKGRCRLLGRLGDGHDGLLLLLASGQHQGGKGKGCGGASTGHTVLPDGGRLTGAEVCVHQG